MIENIDIGTDRVVALRASSHVTHDDYTKTLVPALEAGLEAARASGHKVRFYYELGEGFEGYTAHALWDDARVGGEHLRDFERIAVVTDHPVFLGAVRLFGPLISGEVRAWPVAEREEARAWISTL